MPESSQNNQSDFIMIEKIKERPVNKKKLLRRTIITASMAVIFGLIACFTFLILEPVISNLLYPEEEPQVVVFPEDQEEMSPEEMLVDSMQQELQNQPIVVVPPENTGLELEQIRELLASVTLSLDNYKQLYTALATYVYELKQSMVTVTGVSSNLDWLNNLEESKNQASGVIIANNGKELLILVDYTPLQKAESLSLSFHNGLQVEATVKGKDPTTNLAVLAVDLALINQGYLDNGIKIATLGSSNVQNILGTPTVALGRPMGTNDSLGYGVITSVSNPVSGVDTNYKLLQTDITGSQNAGGVLFNLNGQVVGIITNTEGNSDMKNMVTAYGITELKKRVEKMSNGEKAAYLGISGVEVTKEAHDELGVPYGAFVKEVAMDSPAMLAGIQQGDVLVQVVDKDILSYNEYIRILMEMKVGDTVELTVMRLSQEEYKEMKFQVTLGVME